MALMDTDNQWVQKGTQKPLKAQNFRQFHTFREFGEFRVR